jgi:hypothetical protein
MNLRPLIYVLLMPVTFTGAMLIRSPAVKHQNIGLWFLVAAGFIVAILIMTTKRMEG